MSNLDDLSDWTFNLSKKRLVIPKLFLKNRNSLGPDICGIFMYGKTLVCHTQCGIIGYSV